MANENFFTDISNLLPDQDERLSYGVAVADFNRDGKDEFIVTGFGYENLSLSFENNKIIKTFNNELFADEIDLR